MYDPTHRPRRLPSNCQNTKLLAHGGACSFCTAYSRQSRNDKTRLRVRRAHCVLSQGPCSARVRASCERFPREPCKALGLILMVSETEYFTFLEFGVRLSHHPAPTTMLAWYCGAVAIRMVPRSLYRSLLARLTNHEPVGAHMDRDRETRNEALAELVDLLLARGVFYRVLRTRSYYQPVFVRAGFFSLCNPLSTLYGLRANPQWYSEPKARSRS
jgi:hypothetical protein